QRSSNMGWPLRAEVCCAATSEDEEAAEQLAQLEAELEALEETKRDEMEEDRQERVRRADQDQAAAMNKGLPSFHFMVKLKCFMLALGGLDATAVAEQLLERLKKEAPDNQQPVFLNLAEVSRHKFSNKTLILLLPVALRFAQDFFFGQQTSGKMMQSAAPSSVALAVFKLCPVRSPKHLARSSCELEVSRVFNSSIAGSKSNPQVQEAAL
ncbi:unnamed protein product, partial [Symbiodinium sp. KB8]